MSRASLIQRAIELQKLVKDSRAVLSLAAGEEAASDILGLLEEIIRRTGEFLSSGNENIEDYRRLQVMIDEARRLLNQALTGRDQVPIRKRAKGEDQEDVDADDENSRDEEPASEDEKSPQSDFAVSLVPKRRKKADEPEGIDVSEDDEESDSDDPAQARWPSEQMKPPSQGKAAHGLAKSLSARDERLRILLAEPDIRDLLTPVSRKRKGSAIMNVKGA